MEVDTRFQVSLNVLWIFNESTQWRAFNRFRSVKCEGPSTCVLVCQFSLRIESIYEPFSSVMQCLCGFLSFMASIFGFYWVSERNDVHLLCHPLPPTVIMGNDCGTEHRDGFVFLLNPVPEDGGVWRGNDLAQSKEEARAERAHLFPVAVDLPLLFGRQRHHGGTVGRRQIQFFLRSGRIRGRNENKTHVQLQRETIGKICREGWPLEGDAERASGWPTFWFPHNQVPPKKVKLNR